MDFDFFQLLSFHFSFVLFNNKYFTNGLLKVCEITCEV